MFCTNCGEEMRATDKFCANCGAAAAPRPGRPRAAAPVPPEPTTPARSSQSTAEIFQPPVPASAGNASQPDLRFSTTTRQGAPAPAPPVTASAPPSPQAVLSSQQEQQVLLEAEEIASVRGMSPVEALPPDFPPATRAPQTKTCGSCGGPNPVSNRFCERCGRPLQNEPAVQSAPAPAPVRPVAPAPILQSSWLDVPEPARTSVAAPVKTPAVTKAATAPAPPATAANGKDKDFFYFYDDSSSQRGNRKLLIALMVVLALGVLGVIYLLSRPSAKSSVAANVAITISPTETEVSVGEAHDFSATVSGSGDTDVTWSVVEGSAGGTVVNRGAQAQGGAVANMGVYVAPTTPGTYHIVATSKADPSKSATAEVLVSGK